MGPLVAEHQLQDHIFPLLRYKPAQYTLFSTWLLGSSPMKCLLFGHCILDSWLASWLRRPTPRKETFRISSSQGDGDNLPWMKESNFYKEATSLLKATQCGGEIPGLSDAISWDCWSERHSCSCLSLIVGTNVDEMHKRLILDRSDIWVYNSVEKWELR